MMWAFPGPFSWGVTRASSFRNASLHDGQETPAGFLHPYPVEGGSRAVRRCNGKQNTHTHTQARKYAPHQPRPPPAKHVKRVRI